jgi:hypothetical protein
MEIKSFNAVHKYEFSALQPCRKNAFSLKGHGFSRAVFRRNYFICVVPSGLQSTRDLLFAFFPQPL